MINNNKKRKMNEIKRKIEKEFQTLNQELNSQEYVSYNDYQRLNNRFQDLNVKYKQIKSENNELKSILNKIDENIAIYKESKENIEKLLNIVQHEYQKLINQLNNCKRIVYTESSFNFTILSDTDSNSISIIDQYKDLTEKYKTLKDEHSKCLIGKHCSTTNSTNLNFKNDKYQSIKNSLFDHYFGTLILDAKDDCLNNNNNNNNNTTDNNIDDNTNNIFSMNNLINCEPVPSIYKCLKKCL